MVYLSWLNVLILCYVIQFRVSILNDGMDHGCMHFMFWCIYARNTLFVNFLATLKFLVNVVNLQFLNFLNILYANACNEFVCLFQVCFIQDKEWSTCGLIDYDLCIGGKHYNSYASVKVLSLNDQRGSLLGFVVAHLMSKTKVLFIRDMGSYVLRCISEDDEDLFKKTSMATDVWTWTMMFRHEGSREYMFPIVSKHVNGHVQSERLMSGHG
jgi:hypothetical protein